MYEGSTQLKFRANFVDAGRNVPTRLRLVKATAAIVKPTMSIRLGYASPTLYCSMCSHFIPQYVRLCLILAVFGAGIPLINVKIIFLIQKSSL